MSLKKESFGRMPDGTTVDLYTLMAGKITVKVTNFGGRITEWQVPDRAGKVASVVLGFDNLRQYLEPNPYFGATVGRVANRIAKGEFTLDGTRYSLPVNNGPNTLHGGKRGFDKVIWKTEQLGDNALRLMYVSGDGEEGFPGNLHATVTFTLDPGDGALTIDCEATTDKPTPVNLSNHSYFNLAGAGSGDVLGHMLTLHADAYTPVDATLIPTGEIRPVRGTPMDFTEPHTIGSRIAQVSGGYDHNYVLSAKAGAASVKPAALVREPNSGRTLEILTTQPGVQFYSGNFLNGKERGIGGVYEKHGGFCLETQHFPDSVHHENFPSTILRPGERYRESAVYRFSAS